MATCVDAGTILQQLTSEMMSVGATNFDRRPDLKSSLFMLGVLSSDAAFAAELATVLAASSRGTVNSMKAAQWFMSHDEYKRGLALGQAMAQSLAQSMAGGRKGRKGRKQRGGRSRGFKRALAWMVTISIIAASYYGQAAVFSQAFKMNTTLSGLQSMLNGYLISKGVLYGRCDSALQTGVRSIIGVVSGGNVWTCSQFAAADEKTMTAIYAVLAASGYTATWATGGAQANMERLVDAVDYVMFEGMPELGTQVVANARGAAGRAYEAVGRMSGRVSGAVGRATGAVRGMFARAPAAVQQAPVAVQQAAEERESCPRDEAEVVERVGVQLAAVAAELPAPVAVQQAPDAQIDPEVQAEVARILGGMVEGVASHAEMLRDEAAANDEEMKDAADYGGRRRRRKSNKRKSSGKRRTKRAAPKRKTRKGKNGKGKKRSTRRR